MSKTQEGERFPPTVCSSRQASVRPQLQTGVQSEVSRSSVNWHKQVTIHHTHLEFFHWCGHFPLLLPKHANYITHRGLWHFPVTGRVFQATFILWALLEEPSVNWLLHVQDVQSLLVLFCCILWRKHKYHSSPMSSRFVKDNKYYIHSLK